MVCLTEKEIINLIEITLQEKIDKNEVKNIVKQKHLKGSRASRVLQAVNARMSVRFGEGGCKCDVA